MQGNKAVSVNLAVARGKKDGATIFDSLVASTLAKRGKYLTGESATNIEQISQGLLPLLSHTSPYYMIFALFGERLWRPHYI